MSGDSGVLAYEFMDDGIKIQFSNGDIYTYTNESIGRHNIETMKQFAVRGRGLSTFISTTPEVRYGYASKFS